MGMLLGPIAGNVCPTSMLLNVKSLLVVLYQRKHRWIFKVVWIQLTNLVALAYTQPHSFGGKGELCGQTHGSVRPACCIATVHERRGTSAPTFTRARVLGLQRRAALGLLLNSGPTCHARRAATDHRNNPCFSNR